MYVLENHHLLTTKMPKGCALLLYHNFMTRNMTQMQTEITLTLEMSVQMKWNHGQIRTLSLQKVFLKFTFHVKYQMSLTQN